ncbi:hypothetical protein GCM10010253_64000 [Streptomyces badius]|uniref:Uncharacterized protein n=1 Tax=Streptomyces badius TaxID=1941 RepID=A0ABQ2TNI6_STRBA|nr:hypothetical protein GCM10010253_64000 [Streptomyces badius]
MEVPGRASCWRWGWLAWQDASGGRPGTRCACTRLLYLARAHAARAKMAAALNEDQEPEPDEPAGWQPVWKRPRTPESKAAKKFQLHKQGRRL